MLFVTADTKLSCLYFSLLNWNFKAAYSLTFSYFFMIHDENWKTMTNDDNNKKYEREMKIFNQNQKFQNLITINWVIGIWK